MLHNEVILPMIDAKHIRGNKHISLRPNNLDDHPDNHHIHTEQQVSAQNSTELLDRLKENVVLNTNESTHQQQNSVF